MKILLQTITNYIDNKDNDLTIDMMDLLLNEEFPMLSKNDRKELRWKLFRNYNCSLEPQIRDRLISINNIIEPLFVNLSSSMYNPDVLCGSHIESTI